MIYSGLFLTTDGLKRAEELHSLAMSENVNFVPKVKDLVVQTFWNDEATYDDFYAALYGVKLAGRDEFDVNRARQTEGERVASLRALLNIDLQRFNRKTSFRDSLINEYDVANIMKFLGALREMIPYNVVIETLGVGCIWMEYGIYGKRTRSGRLPFLDKEEVETVLSDAQRAEQANSAASTWGHLKKRFDAQIELKIN